MAIILAISWESTDQIDTFIAV